MCDVPLLTGLPQPFPCALSPVQTRTEVKKESHTASSFFLLAIFSYCGLPSSSTSNPRAEYCRRLPLISPPPAVFLSPPILLVVLPGGLRSSAYLGAAKDGGGGGGGGHTKSFDAAVGGDSI